MTAQFEKYIEPIQEFNELTLKNFETVADLQLKSTEENVKIGLEQVKSASTVTDAEAWKSYLDTQAEVAQQYGDRLLANTRTIVEIGNAYSSEVQRIVKDAFAVQ